MDASPFAGLIQDKAIMVKVFVAVEAAVLGSFDTDQLRIIVPRHVSVTHAEVKRRTAICMKIFRALRGDMKWSWMRAVDYIPRFLRMELDGQSWEPDANGMWAPEARIE